MNEAPKIDERNPFEILVLDVQGILLEQGDEGFLQEGENFTANDELNCFKWRRILAGAYRGLYIENVCKGTRSVDVSWYRGGTIMETVSYRIPGNSRRRVQERSNDGRLVSETLAFSCHPNKLSKLCGLGANVLNDVDIQRVSNNGIVDIYLKNNSSRYIFAFMIGNLNIGGNLGEYSGELLIAPYGRPRVMSISPASGETFNLPLAREEPR
ncbi:hypothetical protein [Roseibium sp.]|uniref:hypothetical protein n=1 Tax=Roseibium sp. TaxID=1936156 RepID=UPI003B5101DC